MTPLKGSLLVCGTASDVGKSQIVAGICRVLLRQGVRVSPFKAQNMALNSYVTEEGLEIGRAQAHQARAAQISPEVAMNPILLKPNGEMTSELILMGKAVGEVRAGDHLSHRRELLAYVLQALSDLQQRYDVVVAEGAGGAAEINLLEADIVNLPLAKAAEMPAIVIGDIERGGVFAAIYGTISILPDDLRRKIRGFVINKFRGDPALLAPGIEMLEERCGVPCLGVLPYLADLFVDAEDSLALGRSHARPEEEHTADKDMSDVLDVAVIQLPHISNFTDFDPLAIEPHVRIRYVLSASEVGEPDLIVLPGSKTTVTDLEWLRERGIDHAINCALAAKSSLLGICAGYQMLGTSIDDRFESGKGRVDGLGVLDVATVFAPDKRTGRRIGRTASGEALEGYEIHRGLPTPAPELSNWFELEGTGDRREGVADSARGIFATSLHGIFENDQLRRAFLADIAERHGKIFVAANGSFLARREFEIDLIADTVARYLDLSLLRSIIEEGSTLAPQKGAIESFYGETNRKS